MRFFEGNLFEVFGFLREPNNIICMKIIEKIPQNEPYWIGSQ